MLIRIMRYITKKEWWLIAASLALVFVQVWLELALPGQMNRITVLVQEETAQLGPLLETGGWMLLCALGSMAASILGAFLAAQISAGYAMRLREQVFQRVQSFSLEEMQRFSVPSLITRSTNDVTQVQTIVVVGLQVVVRAPIMAGLAIGKIVGRQWQWTLATGVSVAVILLLYLVVFLLAEPKFRSMQRLTDDLNRVTREHLTGLRVVRAFNAERFQHGKFMEANQALTNTNLFVGRVMALMMPCINLVLNGLTLAVYWLGAALIASAAVELRVGLFADMVVFSSYAMQIIFSFMMLVEVMIMAPRALVSARRVLEVLETEPNIRDGEGATPGAAGSVEFRDVSFRYPGDREDTLHHISFTARAGETVAIIGATGSGKTTLLDLVPRFYDVSGGSVLVDGVDVRRYRRGELRRRLGVVTQKAVLFTGTVAFNVAGEEEAAAAAPQQETLDAALDTAQAAEFVRELPEGSQGRISQGGTNLSGGQRQRLSIARALYRQPEILLLDDAFSALDYQTDRRLRSALRQRQRDVTCLLVAQRIGTILDADRIVVLDKGRVAGVGSHQSLMETCPIYREIAESQLSEEELRHV